MTGILPAVVDVSGGNTGELTQRFLSIFPHEAGRFVDTYERRGANVYNQQAREIIHQLTADPNFRVGAQPIILRGQDIERIVNHLTDRMFERFTQILQRYQAK